MGPTTFGSDPIISENKELFQKIWQDLHSNDLFRDSFKMPPYGKECYGVHLLSGHNDAKLMM